jgi:homeobox-leucine zipper protein
MEKRLVYISVLYGLLLDCHLAHVMLVIHYKLALQDVPLVTRTLDLASVLEVGPGGALHGSKDMPGMGNERSVLTIAFQFSFEDHLCESAAAMARQYVRAVMTSVQRVAMTLSPPRIGSQIEMKHPPSSPEAQTLARWIRRSYR